MTKKFEYSAQLFLESMERLTSARWGYFVGALIMACACGYTAYRGLDGPQKYPDFVPGAIVWMADYKTRDLWLLYAFLFGFLVNLAVIALLASALAHRAGPTTEASFHDVLIMACVPAAIWFAASLLSKHDHLMPIGLSVVLITSLILTSSILSFRGRDFWTGDLRIRQELFVGITLVIFLSGFAGAAIAFVASRLGIMAGASGWPVGRTLAFNSLGSVFLGTCVSVFISCWRCGTAEILEQRLRLYLFAVQAFLPLLFLVLLPTPLDQGGQIMFGFPITSTMLAVIGFAVGFAYLDLYRCLCLAWRQGAGIMDAVSPLCLVAILLFVKSPAMVQPAVSGDDYHFGELLIPWWTWTQHNMLPFWDYSPARGLVNYLPGAMNALIFDGRAATLMASFKYIAFIVLVVAFPLVAASIGKGPAAIAFLFMPIANGLSEIDVLLTAAICLFCEKYLHWSPHKWFVLWVVGAVACLLIAPGQGALAILATAPLMFLAIFQAWREDRVRLTKVASILLVALGLILVITPLGRMVGGAIRYGMEQSSLNLVANGIAWEKSFGANSTLTPWLFEITRTSWMAVALFSGITLCFAAGNFQGERRRRLVTYALPIFLLMALFVMRAAGRIDPGPSRLGIASIWALALLLPVLIFAGLRPASRVTGVFLCALIAAVVAPWFGFTGSPIAFLRSTEIVAVSAKQSNLINGAEAGFTNLGRGQIDVGHLDRLTSLQRILSRVLDNNETYLDLTSRNAQYFYFDRPPPIEVGAIYNLVHTNQQLRAVEALRRNPPPIVLASANNILHDGGPAGFRAHLLYRYVIQNYVPVEVDGFVWMVRPDRLARLGLPESVTTNIDESGLILLDKAFGLPNLDRLPVAWGRSVQSLSNLMYPVLNITDEMRISAPDGDVKGDQSSGKQVSPFVFNLTPEALDGESAGLLSFDFQCGGAVDTRGIEVRWATRARPELNEAMVVRFQGSAGRLIVPLDAQPRWLTAKQITKLSIGLNQSARCKSFSVKQITLSQRKAADLIGTTK